MYQCFRCPPRSRGILLPSSFLPAGRGRKYLPSEGSGGPLGPSEGSGGPLGRAGGGGGNQDLPGGGNRIPIGESAGGAGGDAFGVERRSSAGACHKGDRRISRVKGERDLDVRSVLIAKPEYVISSTLSLSNGLYSGEVGSSCPWSLSSPSSRSLSSPSTRSLSMFELGMLLDERL